MANIAIVGATGVVGTKMIERLDESSINIENIYFFSSKRSAGKKLEFRGKEYMVEELSENSFSKEIDYAVFSAGGDTSLKFAPIAEENGVIVIDNSSAWRMNPDIDLVVPECNNPTLKRKIIANPNCSTIQSVVPLKPLNDRFGIKRIAYTTYQAVSGAGHQGIEDLKNGEKGIEPQKFNNPIYNNVIPQIDVFLDNGYTKEEMKMVNETKKILNLSDNVKITATCVRVPVFNSHSVEINVTFDMDTTEDEIRNILRHSAGIVVIDDIKNTQYPTPRIANGSDSIFVGRIRRDISQENSFHIWCVGDNIRKGAASNAVQIVEMLEGINLF